MATNYDLLHNKMVINPLSAKFLALNRLLPPNSWEKIGRFQSILYLQMCLITHQQDLRPRAYNDMDWGCTLLGYHPKVRSRSFQGHVKVISRSNQQKSRKKMHFYHFQPDLCCSKVLQMTAVGLFLTKDHFDTHPKGVGGNISFVGVYHLGIPLMSPPSPALN